MREYLKHAGFLSVIFTMPALLFAAMGSADESGSATFVARQATTTSSLIGFTRARAKMKLISQVSDKVVEVRSDIGDLINKDGYSPDLTQPCPNWIWKISASTSRR